MPLFALMLWVLLYSKKYFFTEVLIFSVYFHTFLFLLLILALLGNRLAGISGLNHLAYLVACVYAVPSIRIAFDLSYLRSTMIALALIILYTLVFFLVMTSALIGSMVF